jgi:GNAT superfamily N-acetyltransferase
MEVVIRDALLDDVDAVYRLGRSDRAFTVSEEIPFYERSELVEWIQSPDDNMLCVALRDGCLVGFFFCKVMSAHWAMLDNFYVVSDTRSGRVGRLLFDTLTSRLRQRGVVYLTTLVETGRVSLERLLRQEGFRLSKSYNWHELFLD